MKNLFCLENFPRGGDFNIFFVFYIQFFYRIRCKLICVEVNYE